MEKKGFSFVMIMFETLSEKADMIVPDDYINAFDKNKKLVIKGDYLLIKR